MYFEFLGEQSVIKMLFNNKLVIIIIMVVVLVMVLIMVSIIQLIVSSMLISLLILIWCWLIDGKVIENFSGVEGGNKGIDIVGSKGQVIVVIVDGCVVYVGNVLCGYGNFIIIKYNDDYLSVYVYNDIMLVWE